jgi:chorismate mutase
MNAELPATASTTATAVTSTVASRIAATGAVAGSAAVTAAGTRAGLPAQDEPAADALSGVPGGRARIDAIDAELIELIRRRVAVSAEIQSTRIADGGRRLDLSRETEVIGRYTRSLGRPGTSVAMALLELGRGRV